MKAGITIDKYKLKVFEKRLKEAGYEYDVHPTPTGLLIRVECDSTEGLSPLIEDANNEARRNRHN